MFSHELGTRVADTVAGHIDLEGQADLAGKDSKATGSTLALSPVSGGTQRIIFEELQ